MIIDRKSIGAYKGRYVYSVCTDAQETGGKMREIATFDTLELATIVMRYMRGDSLSKVDEQRAHEAITAIERG